MTRAQAISLVGGLLAGLLLAGAALHVTGLGAAPAAGAGVPPARVAMMIAPNIHRGPDGKLHDAFTPTDLRARAGQHLIVTVYNYDMGPHSVMAPALHLNVTIPPAPRVGVAAVRVFALTVQKAGVYAWHCMKPCDDAAHGWAMSHPGFMAGTITITPA